MILLKYDTPWLLDKAYVHESMGSIIGLNSKLFLCFLAMYSCSRGFFVGLKLYLFNCCYATKSDSQLKNHYENFSNHKASTVNTNVVLIMSRTITAAKEAELNQCSR